MRLNFPLKVRRLIPPKVLTSRHINSKAHTSTKPYKFAISKINLKYIREEIKIHKISMV
jgi:hypothetical protein